MPNPRNPVPPASPDPIEEELRKKREARLRARARGGRPMTPQRPVSGGAGAPRRPDTPGAPDPGRGGSPGPASGAGPSPAPESGSPQTPKPQTRRSAGTPNPQPQGAPEAASQPKRRTSGSAAPQRRGTAGADTSQPQPAAGSATPKTQGAAGSSKGRKRPAAGTPDPRTRAPGDPSAQKRQSASGPDSPKKPAPSGVPVPRRQSSAPATAAGTEEPARKGHKAIGSASARAALRRHRAIRTMDTEEEIERAPWTMEQLESLLTDLIRAPTPPERFLLVDYTYLSYRALEDKVRAAGIPVPSLSLNRMLLHFGYENCQMRYVGASKELSVLASPRPRMEQFAYLESRAGKCGKEGIPVVCINTRVTSPLFCDPPAWRRVGLPRSQKPLPRFEIPREDLDRSPPLSVFAFDPVRALSVTSPESLAQARKDRRTSCPRLALEALACWWESVGSLTCPDAPSLFVILDLPGSTYDLPAPEMERDLKRFAAYIRKPIQIAYVPPMIYRWVAPAHTILLCSKKVRHHAKKGDGDIDIDARAITLSPRENLVFRPVDSVRMDFLDWPAGSVSKKEILLDDPINPEHPDRQYSRLTPGWNYLLDPR